MADIYPFRGVTYSKERVGDISLVATQPYDKIDPDMQKAYHERHPNNIVRIIKGLEEPGDTDKENRYSRAARCYGIWRKEGVLRRAERPAIYPYHQTFTVEGGPEKVRRGFIALGRLVEFGEGVRPHERTLAGPKADRLRLLRATRVNFGQIFMLYSDPAARAERILSPHTHGPPVIEARDDYGTLHQVWEVADEGAIDALRAAMKPFEVFIADGHHRYEVALSFRDEMRAKGVRCEGLETPERRMMTFINMEDKGLTIFPTHRLLFGLESRKIEAFRADLGRHFMVEEYEFTGEEEEQEARGELLENLHLTGAEEHCFGLALSGEDRYYLLTLQDSSVLDNLPAPGKSRAYRELDVAILHSLILEHYLGVDAGALEEERNVHYERSADEALDLVRGGRYQAALLLNPTKVHQVKEVALAGEKMPQKSTDFYPKLLTGLVMNELSIIDG